MIDLVPWFDEIEFQTDSDVNITVKKEFQQIILINFIQRLNQKTLDAMFVLFCFFLTNSL